MSTRITHQADGTARGQTQQNTANSIIDLRKQPAHTPKQAEPAKPDCCGQPPVPARQKNAREYLAGRSPGVMQSYAPNAAASPVEGWVEDDETVHRLAHWREEAIIECRVCGKFYYSIRSAAPAAGRCQHRPLQIICSVYHNRQGFSAAG